MNLNIPYHIKLREAPFTRLRFWELFPVPLLLVIWFTLFLWTGQVAIVEAVQTRSKVSINELWKFHKGDEPNARRVEFNDEDWQQVQLPHTWNSEDPFDDEPGYYRGDAWYRKTITLPVSDRNKRIFIHFEAANQVAELFVNGTSVGIHKGGYTAFTFDITEQITPGEPAQLAVKVNNAHNDNIIPLKGDFNFYGGIYRDVYLIKTNAIHFDLQDYATNGVYLEAHRHSGNDWLVNINQRILNETSSAETITLQHELKNKNGRTLKTYSHEYQLSHGLNQLNSELRVTDPELWSPDHPNVYSVYSRIREAGQNTIIDDVTNPLGFRTFNFDAATGFSINGKPAKLIGANRHQDYKGMGNALPDAMHRNDMEHLKKMGANFYRTAHYPQDPAILQAADNLGFVVSMEIPLDHEITDAPAFYVNTKEMMSEMIHQYYNHPSIMIWAYMNEMFLGKTMEKDRQQIEKTVAFARELEQLTRAADSTRYTMIPNHGAFDIYTESGLTDIPMIVGWNLYFGWYAPEVSGLSGFFNKHRRDLPDKPMIMTEYGAGADPRIHSSNPLRFDFSIEWQTHFHQNHLEQITATPHVAGAAVWNLADFGSVNRNDAVPHINNKGLMTFDRKPKSSYYLYQAWLHEKPYLKIDDSWKRRAAVDTGATDNQVDQIIDVYTNLPEVTVTLNGKIEGTKTAEDHINCWKLPFKEGENLIEAAAGEGREQQKDAATFYLDIKPNSLKDMIPGESININVGAPFYFTSEVTGETWLPDRESNNSHWGYVGGETFHNRNRGVGTDRAILNTPDDPLYQTQRQGIQKYVLDVPEGSYDLTLLFSELEVLENSPENKARIFNITVNKKVLLSSVNIGGTYGTHQAVSKTFQVACNSSNGLVLAFDAKSNSNQPILNGITITRR